MSYSKDIVLEKLASLEETQISIQSIGQWCLFHHRHAPETVAIWSEFVGSTQTKKLAGLYLANEIIQQSRAKRKTTFLDEFAKVLPSTLEQIYPSMISTHQAKLKRIIDVWSQRKIFDSELIHRLYQSIQDQKVYNGLSSSSSNSPPINSGDLAPEISSLSTLFNKISTLKSSTSLVVNQINEQYSSLFDSETLPGTDIFLKQLGDLSTVITSARSKSQETQELRESIINELKKLIQVQESWITKDAESSGSLDEKLATVQQKESELKEFINDVEEEDGVPQYAASSDEEGDENVTKKRKMESPPTETVDSGEQPTNPVHPQLSSILESLSRTTGLTPEPASTSDDSATATQKQDETPVSSSINPALASLLSKLNG
ncbi:hypothetical protein LJB42_002258 [Komagataella kurtzmanii]|nr:hypothetical protein LJB42_002258 [Komagataella kurtzmanii]